MFSKPNSWCVTSVCDQSKTIYTQFRAIGKCARQAAGDIGQTRLDPNVSLPVFMVSGLCVLASSDRYVRYAQDELVENWLGPYIFEPVQVVTYVWVLALGSALRSKLRTTIKHPGALATDECGR